MRRRYEHGSRFWRSTNAFADIDAVLVNRYRANLRARRDERKAGQSVSWIFDPDFLVWSLQDPDNNIDRLLRARRDHDLFGFAPHGARGPKIVTDGLA